MPITAGLSAAAINAALGYTAANAANVVAKDNGGQSVGSFTYVTVGNPGVGGSAGGGGMIDSGGATLPGTWRGMSSGAGSGIVQRIA